MPGQIPKYGRDFRRESVPWTPDLANRIYVLKADPAWFIRSDKASGTWRIYWHFTEHLVTPVGTPLPTLGQAMTRLLDGIGQGFYAVSTS
jgi:hypothetical protein